MSSTQPQVDRGWKTWTPWKELPAPVEALRARPPSQTPLLTVPRVPDFRVTGGGEDAVWSRAGWTALRPTGPGTSAYTSRFKMLCSDTSLYFLFDFEDRRLSASMTRDGDEIWREDALEIFLWPNELEPRYFQYDLSPLGVELPLMIPNHAVPMGWAPWRYAGERRVEKATSIQGGERAPMASIARWRAEIRVPFVLLAGLILGPPRAGDRWRANVYRTDCDVLPTSHWAWSEAAGTDTHALRTFGTLVFG